MEAEDAVNFTPFLTAAARFCHIKSAPSCQIALAQGMA
jgi:hypothetical protein